MKQESIKLQRLITKDEEKIYLSIQVNVPKDVFEIEVRYKYKRWKKYNDHNGNFFEDEINIIDLSIVDPLNVCRGSSGSERSQCKINENSATPGYLKGKIMQGNWNIILGAYKIEDYGCKVDIEVIYTFKERVLMKGDLHNHSNNSDGKYTVDEVLMNSKLNGLDFICLTDHNTISQNSELNNKHGIIAIPGMEWTHYKGHCNFIGVKRPISNYVTNNIEGTIKILEEASENGAIIILNHPFCNYCPWEWGFEVPFDGIEVWNGPMKESEMRAITWWHNMLVKGKKIPVVGGSDSHKNELFRFTGSPSTCIYPKSKGISDILEAIRNGNLFISYTVNGPMISMEAKDKIMGDTISENEFDTIKIEVENLRQGDVIKVINQDGEYKTVEVNKEKKKVILIDDKSSDFYRVEVWRLLLGNELILVSLTNPIYISR